MSMFNSVIRMLTYTKAGSRKRKVCWVSIIGGLMVVGILLTFVMALVGSV
jgi:hypothetical protein